MESFGAHLKNLRESQGKTLEEISESTKVAVANLDFLERDRYDLLPPKVFVKGFIRAYAQEMRADPNEIIKKFEDFVSEGEMPEYSEDEYPVLHEVAEKRSFIFSPLFTIVLTGAGILSLIILVLTGVTRLFFPDEISRSTSYPAVVGQVATNTISTKPTLPGDQTPQKSAFADPPRRQPGKKVLEIKALAGTWVRVEPDTGAPEELVMAPGDIQVFTAHETFHILVGNAGGVRIRYDGKEYPVLGKTNQTLTLTLP
ncbi:MAG: cytoskeleton protein RodZ [Thermodesulfobacteriota bacterium]|nr:cytoskeleton protein RodZ [Thermodesulfobacteriota bacterium]